MSKENPKIIETIKKVLELASNNPSEEEARAATLKAQELMAKYHIEMSDIDAQDSDISEMYVEVGMGKKWKYQLARVISRNFCCKHFLYGKANVVFYGHSVDVKIASKIFYYLFQLGDKLGHKAYADAKAEYGFGDGVYNSFVSGFVAGIAHELDAQCTALMIVVPQDVEDSYAEKSKGFKRARLNNVSVNDYTIYTQGFNEGRSAMQRRQIG